jgi:hypothetical protein
MALKVYLIWRLAYNNSKRVVQVRKTLQSCRTIPKFQVHNIQYWSLVTYMDDLLTANQLITRNNAGLFLNTTKTHTKELYLARCFGQTYWSPESLGGGKSHSGCVHRALFTPSSSCILSQARGVWPATLRRPRPLLGVRRPTQLRLHSSHPLIKASY